MLEPSSRCCASAEIHAIRKLLSASQQLDPIELQTVESSPSSSLALSPHIFSVAAFPEEKLEAPAIWNAKVRWTPVHVFGSHPMLRDRPDLRGLCLQGWHVVKRQQAQQNKQ